MMGFTCIIPGNITVKMLSCGGRTDMISLDDGHIDDLYIFCRPMGNHINHTNEK